MHHTTHFDKVSKCVIQAGPEFGSAPSTRRKLVYQVVLGAGRTQVDQMTIYEIPGEMIIVRGEEIGQRLNRLSVRCNRVPTAASAVGREFDFDVSARVMDGLTENGVLEGLRSITLVCPG